MGKSDKFSDSVGLKDKDFNKEHDELTLFFSDAKNMKKILEHIIKEIVLESDLNYDLEQEIVGYNGFSKGFYDVKGYVRRDWAVRYISNYAAYKEKLLSFPDIQPGQHLYQVRAAKVELNKYEKFEDIPSGDRSTAMYYYTEIEKNHPPATWQKNIEPFSFFMEFKTGTKISIGQILRELEFYKNELKRHQGHEYRDERILSILISKEKLPAVLLQKQNIINLTISEVEAI